ncbi:MAG: sugar ABC transporter ATP-binding protein [Clostridiaceae bacterium]|nr:sugar ABC transporter ATP-binding protein [Clostridiaceae bacterium]
MGEYVLEMLNVSKAFPGVQALDGVTLRVRPGSVHALMGENGAGKSTLMKCLIGINSMDEGTIILRGEEVNFPDTITALNSGVSMIHQELNPIPLRSISDNLWVGREPRKGKFVLDKKKMYEDSKALLAQVGMDDDPEVLVGTLTVAKQQMIEIAKAVSYDADVIIMDEPTSSLTDSETDKLFEIIRRLRDEGKAIIYISHKMDEIFEICDEATVFRDGKYVGTDFIKNLTTESLIKMMVGRELDAMFPKIDCEIGEPILKVENLSSPGWFADVSFELHRGEILGFAGLVGAGRTEVMETIFGMREKSGGSIYKDGEELDITCPSDAIDNKIGMLTEDRRKTGIVPVSSVLDNISIANIKSYVGPAHVLNHKKMSEEAAEYGSKLSIKTPTWKTPIASLSGGNQQKVLVARWLLTDPDVLIVDEPTRGIDVGAKSEIHSIITNLAAEGKGIIMISSEMPEVMGMADRIIVMHEGRMTGIVDRKDFTQEHIMELAALPTEKVR